MTLNGLENVVRKGYPTHSAPGKFQLTNVWMVRYVDDFVITSPDRVKLEREVIPAVKRFLLEKGLVISEHKSKVIDLREDSLQFLG